MDTPQKPLREWLDELRQCAQAVEESEELLRVLPVQHQHEMQEAAHGLRAAQAWHARVMDQLRILNPFQDVRVTVEYGPGGWHVVWHDVIEDLVSYWYGPKKACKARAKEPPPTLDKFFPLECT